MPAQKSAQSNSAISTRLKTVRKASVKVKPKVAVPVKESGLKKKSREAEAKKLKSAKPKKEKKSKTEKVIRDSFTIPKLEFEKIAELKKRCLKLGVSVKKSEILRAGLHALSALTPQRLKIAVSEVAKVKTGRPS